VTNAIMRIPKASIFFRMDVSTPEIENAITPKMSKTRIASIEKIRNV
jgi:hypothetical protein